MILGVMAFLFHPFLVQCFFEAYITRFLKDLLFPFFSSTSFPPVISAVVKCTGINSFMYGELSMEHRSP